MAFVYLVFIRMLQFSVILNKADLPGKTGFVNNILFEAVNCLPACCILACSGDISLLYGENKKQRKQRKERKRIR
jgi:hypothetical protein